MNLKYSLIFILIFVSVLAQCGNGVCEEKYGETPELCCLDCGCNVGDCKKVYRSFLVVFYGGLFEEITLESGTPVKYGDFELELVRISTTSQGIRAVITVTKEGDNPAEETKIINLGKLETIKTLLIEFKDYEITGACETGSECGNGSCEVGETQVNCCSDCGCSSGQICTNNICLIEEVQAPAPEPEPTPELESQTENRTEPTPEPAVNGDSLPDEGIESAGFIESFLSLFRNLLGGVFGS
jgi:hypothetical protein